MLHNRPVGLVFGGSVFYYRRRVPLDIRAIVGRAEIWKSLRTDSMAIAIRRLFAVVAKISAEFEYVRQNAGLTFDRTLLGPSKDDPATFTRYNGFPIFMPSHTYAGSRNTPCPTLGEVYDRYLGDPTFWWSEAKRQGYVTTCELVMSIFATIWR